MNTFFFFRCLWGKWKFDLDTQLEAFCSHRKRQSDVYPFIRGGGALWFADIISQRVYGGLMKTSFFFDDVWLNLQFSIQSWWRYGSRWLHPLPLLFARLTRFQDESAPNNIQYHIQRNPKKVNTYVLNSSLYLPSKAQGWNIQRVVLGACLQTLFCSDKIWSFSDLSNVLPVLQHSYKMFHIAAVTKIRLNILGEKTSGFYSLLSQLAHFHITLTENVIHSSCKRYTDAI